MATWTGGTSNIHFSNNTDQIYIWGNDTANATTSTTAGGFTDTGTTTSATDGIIWTNAYIGASPAARLMGLGGSIQPNIRVEPIAPGAQMNIVNPYQALIQGPDEAPVPRIITNTVRDTPEKPAEPTPQIIANARGQDLLKEIVGEVMYRRFQKQGWIDVPSLEKPGITYRIRPWQEIALLEKNAKKEWVTNNQSICIHARQRHVEGDEVAAHVLLCRYNEKTLWKMGNLHGVRRAA